MTAEKKARRCWLWIALAMGLVACEAPKSPPLQRFVIEFRDGTTREVDAQEISTSGFGKIICALNGWQYDPCWPLDAVKEWRCIR